MADFGPMIILKAKDSAAEIIILNSKANELKTASGISSEHVINNGTGRETLLQRGMRPEAFPAEADIKKVELRISSEDKSIAKTAECLTAESLPAGQ